MLANPKGMLRNASESERSLRNASESEGTLRNPKESHRIRSKSYWNPKEPSRRPHAVPVRVRACAPQESL
eukprot:674179-Pyramimonas_sp.AAC.1